MSLTALGVLGIYFLALGMAFAYRPIFGLLAYLWIFYHDPLTHWWGAELPDLRYSLTAAVVALIVTVAKTKRTEAWTSSGAVKILIAFVAWCWIQTGWAVNQAAHIEGAILFSKYLVLSFVIWKVCSDDENIEVFMWAHVVGCALFGWEGFTSTVGGRLEHVGGPGVDDANLLAAHMVTGLAIAGFMFLGFKGYKRWVLLGLIPFILNGVILTESRGGFVSLCAAGVAALYLSPKVYRRGVMICGVLAGVLFLMLVNKDFLDRVETIKTADSEQEGRLRMLGPQFQMFLDHPFGAGHRGNEFLSPQYLDQSELSGESGRRSAHNTLVAALVDHGIPGAILIVSLYGWGIVVVRRLKLMERFELPPHLMIYRAALGTSLASLLVSGLFLNLLKTEVQIWLVTLLASVMALSQRAAREGRGAPVENVAVEATRARATNA